MRSDMMRGGQRRRGLLCASAALLLSLAARSAVAQRTAAPGATRGSIVTDSLWAQSLGTTKSLTVYLPPSYAASPGRRYPVLYYLHGLYGDERNWVEAGHIDRALDSLFAAGRDEAIVVMPDGDDGWYTTWNQLPDLAACRADTVRKERADRYCVPWPHYDDYIARDLVTYIDAHYRTKADGRHRAIGGLSMGGYGAITLALSYPGVYAAAASHSGVLSPRLLGPARYAATVAELETASRGLWRRMWPAFGRDTIAWVARDPTRMAALAVAARGKAVLPMLFFDCGVDDTFIQQNRDLHQTLLALGVSHRYAEWPGGHTWTYWSTHVVQSLDDLLATVGDALSRMLGV